MARSRKTCRWLWLAVVVMLLSTACATLDPQVVQQQTHGRSITVASTLAGELKLRWFNNVRMLTSPVDAHQWDLDEVAVRAARDWLKESALFGKLETSTDVIWNGEGRPQFPPELDSELMLLISPGGPPDPRGLFRPGSLLAFRGMGVYKRSGIDGPPTSTAHLGARVQLFDRASGRVLAEATDVIQWPADMDALVDGDPTLNFGELPKLTFAPRRVAMLRGEFPARIRPLVASLLDRMGLR